MDQRSGADLKFHCASDRPFVASIIFAFVDSRYWSVRSFSACVNSYAEAAVAMTKSSPINVRERIFFLISVGSLTAVLCFLPTCRLLGLRFLLPPVRPPP